MWTEANLAIIIDEVLLLPPTLHVAQRAQAAEDRSCFCCLVLACYQWYEPFCCADCAHVVLILNYIVPMFDVVYKNPKQDPTHWASVTSIALA